MAGKSLHYFDQSRELPAVKEVRPDLADVYSQTLQDVLRRLDRSFTSFFRRVKQGGVKAGFPRYQGRSRCSSFTYPQDGWWLRNDRLTLSKIGTIKLRLHRPVCGKVKTVSVRRDGEHWYACFSVEYEFQAPSSRGEAIGIDMGLEHFASLSNGEQITNPRYFRKGEKRLTTAQRRLSKVPKNSPLRRKYRKRLTAAHHKVKHQRADFLHRLSHRLAHSYSLIAVEKLQVSTLASSMLAKSVNDVGWSYFISMLRYKVAYTGAQLIEVDASRTSQTCPDCGQIRKKTLSERWHSCLCGAEYHRDIAAAKVILARGLASIGNQSLNAAAH